MQVSSILRRMVPDPFGSNGSHTEILRQPPGHTGFLAILAVWSPDPFGSNGNHTEYFLQPPGHAGFLQIAAWSPCYSLASWLLTSLLLLWPSCCFWASMLLLGLHVAPWPPCCCVCLHVAPWLPCCSLLLGLHVVPVKKIYIIPIMGPPPCGGRMLPSCTLLRHGACFSP